MLPAKERHRMEQWRRTVSFEASEKATEKWFYGGLGSEEGFDVEVSLGKPVDILSLKKDMVAEFAEKVETIKNTRTRFFKESKLEKVEVCPICGQQQSEVKVVLRIYAAEYCQCPNCSHCFVGQRPSQSDLESFYAADANYQSTYADKESLQTRVQQIAVPKLRWVIDQFRRVHGRKPASILDVGAGSGHFVSACRDMGFKAEGIEVSSMGRRFCKDNFGFELSGEDFLETWQNFTDYDIVTFWGVIEHVPCPLKMLNAASEIARSSGGMVVAEVPRWSCFGTTVQTNFPDSVIRHLEPLGHINCFTDSSLASAFRKSNLGITSAWYFGMDAYETVIQISHAVGVSRIVQDLGCCIPAFQRTMDLARLSDEMVFAGVPIADRNDPES